MKRRTQTALILLGVILSLTVPVVATTVLSEGKDAGQNVKFNKSDGPRVTIGESVQFTNENPWVTSNRITLDPWGNFTSPGPTAVRVDTFNGTWTNTSQLDVGGNPLTIEINDKQRVEVEGGTDSLKYTDMAVDDGSTDFIYSGPDGGTTTLTVYDLPASTTIAAVDTSSSDPILDSTTTSASGVGRFSLPQSTHDVELQTSAGGPTIDDASLSPNSSTKAVDDVEAITLEANVSDPDFPDDTVNVSFYVDGSYVGSETLQSEGTASVTVSENIAGVHDWHVEAEDGYGQTDTSNTAEFLVPNEITVYDESNPQTVVTQVDVTIRFYGPNDTVVERTTGSDGTINMTGLRADKEFIVIARAPDHYDRRVYIESLTKQQSIYLLNTSKQSVYNVFSLVDRSGNYPAGETRLIIQRALDVEGSSEELTWTTIAGDFFGAPNDFPVQLVYNQRYRLIIENDEGDRRVIGAYTATDEDNPKVIEIRSIIVRPPEGQSYYGTAWVSDEDPNPDNNVTERTLQFTYSDPADSTTSLDLVIHERGNESNELVNTTITDVGTEYAFTDTLEGEQTEKAWVVNWTAERNGNTVGQEFPVGKTGGLPIPMDPEWLARFALVALPIFAALASERLATLGAMGTVAFAGILMITGIWEIPVLLWFAALIISVGGHALTKAQRGGVIG